MNDDEIVEFQFGNGDLLKCAADFIVERPPNLLVVDGEHVADGVAGAVHGVDGHRLRRVVQEQDGESGSCFARQDAGENRHCAESVGVGQEGFAERIESAAEERCRERECAESGESEKASGDCGGNACAGEP